MKLVIVGGGAGGASVAARMRRLDEFSQITLFDKNDIISQATCGMPYYLGNVIKDRSRLIVVKPDEFSNLLNVCVRPGSEIVSINRREKYVSVRELASGGTYIREYDKLVLAPGGKPVRPEIKGLNQSNVFGLQNLDDVDKIKAYLELHNCQRAAVVGAGFIGLEVADNLHNLGLTVNIIESSQQVLNTLDFEIASLVHQHLVAKGINLILDDSVLSIQDKDVRLGSGSQISADIVIVSAGVKPDIKLAKDCGLAIGSRGGIVVSQELVTSDENIFALGDSIEVQHAIDGQATLAQLAGPVHKQAAVVADNLCGGNSKYRPVQCNNIVKVFDLTVAMTGYSEKALVRTNIKFTKSYVDLPERAGFYPDAFPIVIKVIFSPNDGKILGAQIIGTRGVDKRIDVIASAIQFGRSVADLAELELAYAPPYSSAKDPVNICGMVASNMLYRDYRVIYWNEIADLQEAGALFVDVRTREEHELQSIPDSLHIPLEELRSRLNEIPRDRKIIVYCQQGKKGYFASCILRQNGFTRVYNLSGGYKLYAGASRQYQAIDILDDKGIVDLEYIYSSKRESLSMQKPGHQDNDPIELNIDATGLSCPGPILKLSKGIKSINDGQYLLITASDAGFYNDVDTWCRRTGNLLFRKELKESIVKAVVIKQSQKNKH